MIPVNSFLASIVLFNKAFVMPPINGWVDFIVIAFLVYVIIRSLFEAHSLSVAIGMMGLVALYAASVMFNLPVTHLVLKTFFGVFLIFIAIIFQKEIRRIFSFVGFFGFNKYSSPTETTVKLISQTVARLSRDRTGALLVFPGKESIERLFDGGISLRGDISEPLLLSIFNDDSPGHDGAVLIEGNKVRKFGVHLPLAEDLEKVKKFGLRHRAALGLSERSDALVLIVSEERGHIGMAQNGDIEFTFDEKKVHDRLAAFFRGVSTTRDVGYASRWAAENLGMIVASLAIAFGAWLFLSPNLVSVQKNFIVPFEFQNVPAGYEVKDTEPHEAVVTLQGPSTDLDSLTAQSLHAVIDLATVKSAGLRNIPVNEEEMKVPANFTIVTVDPINLQVDIEKKN